MQRTLKDQIAKLHSDGLRNFQIVKSLSCSRTTVTKNLHRLGLVPNGDISATRKRKDFPDRQCPACLKVLKSFDFSRTGKRCHKCYHTLRKTNSSIREALVDRVGRLRCSCRRRGWSFDLTPDCVISMLDKQSGKCFYTDVPIFGSDMTIDRIIPSLGYVTSNIVLCTRRSNVMKSDATLDEMKLWMPDWHRRIKNEQLLRAGGA